MRLESALLERPKFELRLSTLQDTLFHFLVVTRTYALLLGLMQLVLLLFIR
jgi:hypothetical protein